MQRMFSPWRSKYIASFSEEPSSECILCKAYQQISENDDYVVTKGKCCYVVMNLYPYNSGHLMVVPYRHISNFTDLTDDESLEIMSLLKKISWALTEIMKPDGYNIGSNIGRSAGAGIDEHIHFHIVPRWNGDTNFMPILGDTKLISEDIRETLMKLRKVLSIK
ncbi:MAG: HIT domain-containing protein [Bacteroidetes bacterium]|nr:HIT domain-containing protein [Bacteroidota bacterium]MBU1421610.1 HIT domain-containing protein [Bacteroidota bacterium]MBU2447591.1 HIT domain-containing protein [Bacteroidota bacterium]MBU2636936.1 HIT domain-containing protein [Bacteroidota bacterium]MDI6779168.1 HIT domain-containing protein [Bacteroidota bacterium]